MANAENDFLQPRLQSNENLRCYRWGSSITEEKGSNVKETWSVSFCHRPPGYHIIGKAFYWRKVWGQGQSNVVGSTEKFRTNESGTSCAVDRYDFPRDPPDSWPYSFATVNCGTVRVYTTKREGTPKLNLKVNFGRTEEFFCVNWVYNADGKRHWWVLAGGKGRVLRIIDVVLKKNIMNLTGHGADIYDVKIHPRDPSLCITASKDESIRLWNLRTGATVVQFQGLKAHHGEVVCLDFDLGGTRFASCSIDNSVRVWDITRDKNVVDSIIESHDAADRGVEDIYFYKDDNGRRRQSRIHIAQQPVFNTRAVHKHYVDCVAWVGDALISKSLHNSVVIWLPGADRESLSSKSTDYTLLQEYPVSGCDVWFIRFGLDVRKKWLAVGGKGGRAHVFNISEYTPKPMVLSPKDCKVTNDTYVRQCAFSDDGEILITVDDNSNVVQYENSLTASKKGAKQKSKTKGDVVMKSIDPPKRNEPIEDEVMEDEVMEDEVMEDVKQLTTEDKSNEAGCSTGPVARSRGVTSSGSNEITSAPSQTKESTSNRAKPRRGTPRKTPTPTPNNRGEQKEIEVITILSDTD